MFFFNLQVYMYFFFFYFTAVFGTLRFKVVILYVIGQGRNICHSVIEQGRTIHLGTFTDRRVQK